MANLPDTQNESNLASEDDDALDPRVQVSHIRFVFHYILFFEFRLN